jgi:hypothetical protein
MDVSYAGAFAGFVIAAAVLWAPFFAIAYHRRKFGGTARSYLLAFGATWAGTAGFFIIWTLLENRAGS